MGDDYIYSEETGKKKMQELLNLTYNTKKYVTNIEKSLCYLFQVKYTNRCWEKNVLKLGCELEKIQSRFRRVLTHLSFIALEKSFYRVNPNVMEKSRENTKN